MSSTVRDLFEIALGDDEGTGAHQQFVVDHAIARGRRLRSTRIAAAAFVLSGTGAALVFAVVLVPGGVTTGANGAQSSATASASATPSTTAAFPQAAIGSNAAVTPLAASSLRSAAASLRVLLQDVTSDRGELKAVVISGPKSGQLDAVALHDPSRGGNQCGVDPLAQSCQMLMESTNGAVVWTSLAHLDGNRLSVMATSARPDGLVVSVQVTTSPTSATAGGLKEADMIVSRAVVAHLAATLTTK
jgi:hypothetical protein